jgi:hypothetical protein
MVQKPASLHPWENPEIVETASKMKMKNRLSITGNWITNIKIFAALCEYFFALEIQ